jgi:hypothetical protein
MEMMIVLDTIGKLLRHGHGMFGWCGDCGSASRHWEDVSARRTPQAAMFDIDLPILIREGGEHSPVVGRESVPCPRCGSRTASTGSVGAML